MSASDHVTIVERFEIIVPFAEFQESIVALSHQLEQDAIPELLTFQYYASPESKEATLILTFANGDAWGEKHSKILFSLEEFESYCKTCKVKEWRICGTLSEKQYERVSKWDGVVFAGPHIAGFVR